MVYSTFRCGYVISMGSSFLDYSEPSISNELRGSDHDDIFYYVSGGDTYTGQKGYDLLYFDFNQSEVSLTANNGIYTAVTPKGRLLFDSIEKVVYKDSSTNINSPVITGASFLDYSEPSISNELRGSDHDDIFYYVSGGDTYTGQKGYDLLYFDFNQSEVSLTANNGIYTAVTPKGRLLFDSIEKVVYKDKSVNLGDSNTAPTGISASATTFNENIAAGSVVANLNSTDPDAGNTFTYALVVGTGSTDNAAFTISGNQLKINASPDFETKPSYSVRVQTKDQGGLTFEKNLIFKVNNLNEAPTGISASATTFN